MSKQLRNQLDKAKGTAQHIVALMFDVRDFTDFCQKADSYDVANFVRRIYIKAIDEYFPDGSYYKPTGDGLLVILPCSREQIKETVNDIVKRSLKFVKDFNSLCKKDPLIYFKTEEK
jgi:GTP cyclohydrolase III